MQAKTKAPPIFGFAEAHIPAKKANPTPSPLSHVARGTHPRPDSPPSPPPFRFRFAKLRNFLFASVKKRTFFISLYLFLLFWLFFLLIIWFNPQLFVSDSNRLPFHDQFLLVYLFILVLDENSEYDIPQNPQIEKFSRMEKPEMLPDTLDWNQNLTTTAVVKVIQTQI